MKRRNFLEFGVAATAGYVGLRKFGPWLDGDRDGSGGTEPIDSSSEQTPFDLDGSDSTPTAQTQISADTEGYAVDSSYFVQYGYDTATVNVGGSTIPSDSAPYKVVVTTIENVNFDEPLGYGYSDRIQETDLPTTTDVDIDLPSSHRGPIRHIAGILPADESIETISSGEGTKLAETDRFEVDDGRVRPAPSKHTLQDVGTEAFARQELEGGYRLSFDGLTGGASWNAALFLYKSIYEWAASESRHRSIPQYVDHAHREGYAATIANILSDIAVDIGFETKREQTAFVIDFVQNLPYVPDDVGTGYNDYTKFVSETLVEANGDCEDTSILTASILSAEPFNYDLTLLYPPQHVAVGLYGTDLPGYYYEHDGRKYYYLETTGEGWDVGDIPDDYRDESVKIVDV